MGCLRRPARMGDALVERLREGGYDRSRTESLGMLSDLRTGSVTIVSRGRR